MGSGGQSCRFRLSSRTRIDTRRPLPDMLCSAALSSPSPSLSLSPTHPAYGYGFLYCMPPPISPWRDYCSSSTQRRYGGTGELAAHQSAITRRSGLGHAPSPRPSQARGPHRAGGLSPGPRGGRVIGR